MRTIRAGEDVTITILSCVLGPGGVALRAGRAGGMGTGPDWRAEMKGIRRGASFSLILGMAK